MQNQPQRSKFNQNEAKEKRAAATKQNLVVSIALGSRTAPWERCHLCLMMIAVFCLHNSLFSACIIVTIHRQSGSIHCGRSKSSRSDAKDRKKQPRIEAKATAVQQNQPQWSKFNQNEAKERRPSAAKQNLVVSVALGSRTAPWVRCHLCLVMIAAFCLYNSHDTPRSTKWLYPLWTKHK